ncbi:hypothetical protein [Acinetobacter sp. USHLN143]|uniref:hypothetical protein n=1 Tax=Acinetobacter sp. USHLN143 TaxID=3081679 RepID=UPI0011DC98B9
MEKLKYLIGIFFLLLVNVTARAEEVYAVSENIRDLDNIENRIFRDIDLIDLLRKSLLQVHPVYQCSD